MLAIDPEQHVRHREGHQFGVGQPGATAAPLARGHDVIVDLDIEGGPMSGLIDMPGSRNRSSRGRQVPGSTRKNLYSNVPPCEWLVVSSVQAMGRSLDRTF